MKITIRNYLKNELNTTIEYLVEREKETYNNIVETVVLSNVETQGLTENEIKTLGFKRVKPVAIRVFEQIEKLNELDIPVDFELIASVPKSIDVMGTNSLTIGQVFEYNAIVYDQYNMPLNVELTWINKVVNSTEKGTIKVTASAGNVTNSMDVNVVERVKTEVEIQQNLIDKLMLDNLEMQLDIILKANLESEVK